MSFGKNQDHLRSNPYAALAHQYSRPAAEADVADRVTFIRRTYLHLAAAVGAFVFLEIVVFTLFGDRILPFVTNHITGMSWLLVLGAFMGASWLANYWAHSETSQAKQYLGLGLYVVAWAAIFVPILAIAEKYFEGAILSAGILTAVVFAGLTLTVFVTRADFSFLRTALVIGGLLALATIVAGTVLNLPIFGTLFSAAMVLFAVGSILYETSNVLHHYRTDQYVGAALALFSGVAMLFWYILRLVMLLSRE
jgi:FtsH-binding integral membrane protein